jgi:uncharacterized membrane protein YgaE (UPF0421/DUF939 family)
MTHNFFSDIQAQRASDRQTFGESCAYAAQAVVATLMVIALYRWLGRGSAMWAAVSAVLVLQPRFRRSLAASAIRVIANLLGAGIGVAISLAVPQRVAAVSIALTLIVLACEFLRLDAGVRSACASVLIVTMATGGSIVERGWERASAVCIGCAVALALQVVLYGILGRRRKSADEGQPLQSGDE